MAGRLDRRAGSRDRGDAQGARLPHGRRRRAAAGRRSSRDGPAPSYYDTMAAEYLERRDLLCGVLHESGFEFVTPDGAYYVLCDTHAVDPAGDDVLLARRLVEQIGVAAVPGSSFYPDPAEGRRTIRFAFPKRLETLNAAADRLAALVFRERLIDMTTGTVRGSAGNCGATLKSLCAAD